MHSANMGVEKLLLRKGHGRGVEGFKQKGVHVTGQTKWQNVEL